MDILYLLYSPHYQWGGTSLHLSRQQLEISAKYSEEENVEVVQIYDKRQQQPIGKNNSIKESIVIKRFFCT